MKTIIEQSKKVSQFDLRDHFVAYMFKTLSKPYLRFFKAGKIPWTVKKCDLLAYERSTLGYHIGDFLNKNGYEIESKMEEHDVYHVLSGTPTSVKDEIRLQFYMLGNGKRSIFLSIVLFTGVVFYTFQIRQFIKSYRKGRASEAFHHVDFHKQLETPYDTIISKYNIQLNKI